MPVKAPRKRVNQAEMAKVQGLLRAGGLETVCEQALCPNISECFGRRVATFLILGKACTRGCAFCNMGKGVPSAPDPEEPERVARAVRELGLRHSVITSVTRDDLPDGGAGAFARIVAALRRAVPDIKVELLVPDFGGDAEALRAVCDAAPDILGHNLETVPRLYNLRRGADYGRSLELLKNAGKAGRRTKSGLMLGMGETEEEVMGVLKDLRAAGCDFLSLGQYLSPTKRHHPVAEYVEPARFERLAGKARAMGFGYVAAGTFVRSSYLADRYLETA